MPVGNPYGYNTQKSLTSLLGIRAPFGSNNTTVVRNTNTSPPVRAGLEVGIPHTGFSVGVPNIRTGGQPLIANILGGFPSTSTAPAPGGGVVSPGVLHDGEPQFPSGNAAPTMGATAVPTVTQFPDIRTYINQLLSSAVLGAPAPTTPPPPAARPDARQLLLQLRQLLGIGTNQVPTQTPTTTPSPVALPINNLLNLLLGSGGGF